LPAIHANLGEPYADLTGDIALYANWTLTIIEIRTADQLNDIRQRLWGSYRLANDISLASYSNWLPIGVSESEPFTGNFDGDGFKITNLIINRSTEDYTGLFGTVGGGTITDLILENASVVGRRYAGAIAGYVSGGTITGSSSTGSVNAVLSAQSPRVYAGGIAGYVSDSTISNCYSTASVTASASASADDNPSNSYSGGIAGYVELNSTIRGCYSTGSVSASASARSDNYGGVSSYSAPRSFSGGIAGLVSNSNITTCYSTGNSTSSAANTKSPDWGNYPYAISWSGGIAGDVIGGIITGCYSTGDISSSASVPVHSSGNARPFSLSGGIAGVLEDGVINNNAAINTSITANTTNSDRNGRYAGRILGDITSGVVNNNLALDAMTDPGAGKFDSTSQGHGNSTTDGDFRRRSTYENILGWRFGIDDNSPWQIFEGNSLPYLYWQQ